MKTGGKVVLTFAAVAATAVGTGAVVLGTRRRTEGQRPQKFVRLPSSPAGPTPEPYELSSARSYLKSGHAAVDAADRAVVRNVPGAIQSYGEAWMFFGQSAVSLGSPHRSAGADDAKLSTEHERLRVRLQALRARLFAALRSQS